MASNDDSTAAIPRVIETERDAGHIYDVLRRELREVKSDGASDDYISWVEGRIDALESYIRAVSHDEPRELEIDTQHDDAEYRTHVSFPDLGVTAGVVLTCDDCDEPMITEAREERLFNTLAIFECPECGLTRRVEDISTGDVHD